MLREKSCNGNKYRLIKKGNYYLVTAVPQKIDGTYDYENEATMGGWPGSHSTDFDNLKEAEICFDVLVGIGNNEEEFNAYLDMGNKNFPNK